MPAMPSADYNYQPLVSRPDLLAFYLGWAGQRTYSLVCHGVIWNRVDSWQEAEMEFGRLAQILLCTQDSELRLLDAVPATALDDLLQYSTGGAWSSDVIMAQRQGSAWYGDWIDGWIEHCGQPGCPPYFPELSFEPGRLHPCADHLLTALVDMIRTSADTLGHRGLCHCGIALCGLCFSMSGGVPVALVKSTLHELSHSGLLNLDAENVLREKLGLVQLSEDRRPKPRLQEMPLPPMPASKDVFSQCNKLLAPSQHDVLAGIFSTAGLDVPPDVPDGGWQTARQELAQQVQPVPDQAVVDAGLQPPRHAEAEQKRGRAGVKGSKPPSGTAKRRGPGAPELPPEKAA
ncbi:MAG: hypothetical protein ACOC93_06625, partial [Planctomycetota bacterium]